MFAALLRFDLLAWGLRKLRGLIETDSPHPSYRFIAEGLCVAFVWHGAQARVVERLLSAALDGEPSTRPRAVVGAYGREVDHLWRGRGPAAWPPAAENRARDEP